MVRCKNNDVGRGVFRVGLTNITNEDKSTLDRNLLNMHKSFPRCDKQLKSPFPTAIQLKAGAPNMLFAKANLDNFSLYSAKGVKLVDVDKELPKVSSCMVAIMLLGMKVKDNELSYMMRIHQLMLKKTPVGTPSDKLLFSVSSGDDEESEEEESEDDEVDDGL